MIVMIRYRLAIALMFGAAASFATAQPPTFQWFRTGAFTTPYGVSADGSVIVGRSRSPNTTYHEAFRWEAGNTVFLGDLPDGAYRSIAYGISGDGSAIVGSSEGSGGNANHPFSWTTDTGMQDIGETYGLGRFGHARGTSLDGSVIVGDSLYENPTLRWEATRWTAGGRQPIADGQTSRAYAVSHDGATIVGGVGFQQAQRPFRWTSQDGIQVLGDLPGGGSTGKAYAVSADGAVVVGQSVSDDGHEAFRWTQAEGMVGLGQLPGRSHSDARAVSADGSIVLGQSETMGGMEAFIWDQDHGMRSLQDVLINEYGLDTGGSRLECASAISEDGLTIVGWGTNGGWIATIPEPATLALVVPGALMLVRRRRKQSRNKPG